MNTTQTMNVNPEFKKINIVIKYIGIYNLNPLSFLEVPDLFLIYALLFILTVHLINSWSMFWSEITKAAYQGAD